MLQELRRKTRRLKVRDQILRRFAVREMRVAICNDVVEPPQRRSIRPEQDREFRAFAIEVHELASFYAVGMEELFEGHRGDRFKMARQRPCDRMTPMTDVVIEPDLAWSIGDRHVMRRHIVGMV